MKLIRPEDVFRCKKKSIESAELEGFELVHEYFCDKTGWGLETEPAITINNLLETIEQKHLGQYAFMTGEGQFQCHIGIFKKGKPSTKRKKVAHNTYMRIELGNRYIRLHDTDILIETPDGVILSSGGWRTLTTKERINKFLRRGKVFQKDFEWFYTNGNDTIPFNDGMLVNDSLNIDYLSNESEG